MNKTELELYSTKIISLYISQKGNNIMFPLPNKESVLIETITLVRTVPSPSPYVTTFRGFKMFGVEYSLGELLLTLASIWTGEK